MGLYQDELNGFKAKYGVKLDIKTQHDAIRTLRGLDDFNFDTSPQKKEYNVYLETLTDTLVDYLEPKVKMESGKTYDLSDVDVVAFIEDFDKVIKAMRTEEDPNYVHKPYANVKLSTMASQAWKKINFFNIPLPSVWGHQIRKGSITHEHLQSVTDGAINAIGNKNNDALTDQDKKHLADILMARTAMETAVNNRGFWSYLNPKNWGPYKRETGYLKSLNNQIKEYEQRGLNMTGILPNVCTTNILSNAYSGLRALIENRRPANQAVAEVQGEVKKEEVKKEEVKKENTLAELNGTLTSKEAAMELVNDKQAMDAQASQVIGSYIDDKFRTSFNMTINGLVKSAAPQCWDKFNKAESEAQRNDVLKEYTVRVFKSVFNGALGPYSTLKPLPEKLAMAQKLTNFIMGTYTPAAASDSYKAYAENYYLENTALDAVKKDTFVQMSDNDLKAAVDQAKSDLSNNRIRLDTNKEFANKDTDVISKIEEIKDPAKVMNKDF